MIEPGRRGSHEPPYGPLKVRPIHAHVSERIKVVWTLADGRRYVECHVAPPQNVIEQRLARAGEPIDETQITPDDIATTWVSLSGQPVTIIDVDGSGVFFRHDRSGDCVTCVNSPHGHHQTQPDFLRDHIRDRRRR